MKALPAIKLNRTITIRESGRTTAPCHASKEDAGRATWRESMSSLVVMDEEGHTSYKASSTPCAVDASKEETGRATSETTKRKSPFVPNTSIKDFSFAATKKRRLW